MDERMEDTEMNQETKSIEERKVELIEQSFSIDLDKSVTDIQVNASRATKLPFDELMSLGTAFSSLPEAFRTVKGAATVSGEGLFRVTDEFGNAINAKNLFKFDDGTGFLGSFSNATGLHQARLNPAGPQLGEVVATVPYDPTTLFVAAALMEINKKLDDIKETQQEMFDYIKNNDKAKLRADLQTLADILNDYRFNWSDKDYVQNKRNLVQFIKRDANQAIIHHRKEIKDRIEKKDLVHFDKNVKDKTQAVRSELEEYRISVYLYAFSSFLEIMMYNNFNENYLQGITEKIENHSIDYRLLYTKAYDLIEEDADSSVRALLLGGLAGVTGFLGKAIEKTPVGDHTPIDEALGSASKNLGELSEGMKQDMMKRLIDASSSDVRPFIENIGNIGRLYNEPVLLMADEEAIYVFPVEEKTEETPASEND